MIHSFLFIGQSNMAGRGSLYDVSIIYNARIKTFRNGIWNIMTEPVHTDQPWAGIGPAASFAEAWLEDHPEDEIGLIPCAHGGTTLEQWQPGNGLFDHAVSSANLALRNSVLDGILWHQGETDSSDDLSATYYQRFRPIVNALRDKLNADDIPFLMGGLGDYLIDSTYMGCSTNYQKINDTLKRFAEQEHDCFYVTAAGLTCKDDKLHLDSFGQRLFGRRFYSTYRNRKSLLAPLPDEDAYIARCKSDIPANEEDRVAKILDCMRSDIQF